MRRNRNRPFRKLQERHTNTRLHEKCHALCFPTPVSYTHLDVYKRQDNILVLDGGTVSPMGTHEDLMRTNDVYRQLQLAAGV